MKPIHYIYYKENGYLFKVFYELGKLVPTKFKVVVGEITGLEIIERKNNKVIHHVLPITQKEYSFQTKNFRGRSVGISFNKKILKPTTYGGEKSNSSKKYQKLPTGPSLKISEINLKENQNRYLLVNPWNDRDDETLVVSEVLQETKNEVLVKGTVETFRLYNGNTFYPENPLSSEISFSRAKFHIQFLN